MKRPRLTYSGVASTLALVLALGTGTVYAANEWTGANIVNGSLTGADIKNGSVAGIDLKNGNVASIDIKDESLTGVDIADESLTGAAISHRRRSGRKRYGTSGSLPARWADNWMPPSSTDGTITTLTSPPTRWTRRRSSTSA